MHRLSIHAIIRAGLVAVILLCTGLTAHAEEKEWHAKRLKAQLRELQAQIDELKQGIHQPLSVDVYCDAGETVTAALNTLAYSNAPVTLTLYGTCSESVVINRDDVTLQGATREDGIEGVFPVLVTNGSSRIVLRSLTLRGQFAGLICSYRGSATATQVSIVDGLRGVSAFYGGTCIVADSLISGNMQGLTVGDSSNIRMQGSIIENSTIGASVFTNGSLTLDSSDSVAKTLVRDNIIGVDISTNGTLRPVSVSIENNLDDGIVVRTGGAVYVADFYTSSVQDNGGDGIDLRDLGKATLTDNFSVSNNGGFGVNCSNTVVLEKASLSPPVADNKMGDFGFDCPESRAIVQ